MKYKELIDSVDLYLQKIASGPEEKLKELSNLKTFKSRIEFCIANFPRLKAGSSRIAFDYSPEYVLKLAKNDKGIAQNNAEADGFIQNNYKDLVANVKDSDPNDFWILAQKATKVSAGQFKILAGFSLEDLRNYLYTRIENKKIFPVSDMEMFNENEFVQELMDLMVNFAMPIGDIVRASSWGKVNDRLVLIDYGLTNSILSDMY